MKRSASTTPTATAATVRLKPTWAVPITSLIVDPPSGRIPPMTPEGQARLYARDAYFGAHPSDGPEDRPLADRRLMFSQSGPRMIPGNYNNN